MNRIFIKYNQCYPGLKSLISTLLISFLCLIPLDAQIWHQAKQLNVAAGLSSNKVNCIIKDSYGYLWFGTDNGLNRYDGYEFQVYKSIRSDSNSLSYNIISVLYEDSKGRLWVGTENGLNLFNSKLNNFVNYFTDQRAYPESANVIRSISEDENGNILVGTSIGIYLLNQQQGKLEKIWGHKDEPACFDIKKGVDGEMYFAVSNGLLKYNNGNPDYCFQTQFNIRAILSHANKIWLGTWSNGILEVINDTIVNRHAAYVYSLDSLNEGSVQVLAKDEKGNVWIGTKGGGIEMYDIARKVFVNPSQALFQKVKYVREIYIDNNQIVWIGTEENGVIMLNLKSKPFYHIPNSVDLGVISAFTIDNLGNGYYGIRGDGVWKQLKGQQTAFKIWPSKNGNMLQNMILCMKLDADENLWIGTDGGGICRYNTKLGESKIYSLDNNYVYSISVGDNKQVWLGTSGGGLAYYDAQKDIFRDFAVNKVPENKLGIGVATAICVDQNKRVWTSFLNEGVYLYSFKDTFYIKEYLYGKNSNEIYGSRTSAIMADSENKIWVGDIGGGISVLNPVDDSVAWYSKEMGLSHDVVSAIIEDNNQVVWVSTSKGLNRIKNEVVESFFEGDGLLSDEFTSAVYKGRKGELYFGTKKGLLFFHPDSIKNDSSEAIPAISQLEILDIEGDNIFTNYCLQHNQKIKLAYNQNNLRVKVCAIHYANSNRNSLRYRLEPLHTEWVQINRGSRRLSFNNLEPGTYAFKLQVANSDGIWNQNQLHINITVLPPFWKSKAAYVFYIVLLLLAILAFRKVLILNEQRRANKRMLILQQEREKDLAQNKLRFFTNISHEFRTPLTLIKGPVEELLQEDGLRSPLKKKLSVVQRNVNRMLELTNQILDIRKIDSGNMHPVKKYVELHKFVALLVDNFSGEAMKRKVLLKKDLPDYLCVISVDRDHLEKIMTNLLSNALKNTNEGGIVTIKVFCKNKEVSIVVQDTGIGISDADIHNIFNRFYQAENQPEESGTGVGLNLVQELVEINHGRINVDSKLGEGSSFILEFPLVQESGKQLVVSEDNTLDVHKKTLLVVEDNSEMCAFIISGLQNEYNILQAENGMMGYEIALQEQPDIIISDVMMPIMDGMEMCEKLKDNPNTSHIPIVLLTAKVGDEFAKDGYRVGADDYLPKPFDKELLSVRLKNILDNKKRTLGISDDVIEKANTEQAKFLKKIDVLIHQNLSNLDLSVTFLADKLGQSRSQFYYSFKELTGLNPGEYIRNIRLRKAALYLKESKMRINELMREVGFEDDSYFRKVFKKEFGMSPKKYRDDT